MALIIINIVLELQAQRDAYNDFSADAFFDDFPKLK
jgi:hypothetical protein